MRTKELAKILAEKGLTPEQVAKLVERYEKQKERAKEYQRQKYYKVSIAVPKEKVDVISKQLGIPKDLVKKYLAGIKAVSSVPEDVRRRIKEFLK
jgi:predicted transcriptional regulator